MTFFSKNETMCKCGCGFDITPEARVRFDELRQAVGIPLPISSAARCADYNKKVGGASDSRHIYGDAMDILCPPEFRYKLVAEAIKLGFKGIGVHKVFIHIDCRASKAGVVWNYT